MTREKLFEFAAEKGWDKILDIAHNLHSVPEIAAKLKKKDSTLQVELRAMCATGLLQLVSKIEGRYRYAPTVLGIRFLQEQNKKVGKTFSCQLCGTTTGSPHVCPEIFPEFK